MGPWIYDGSAVTAPGRSLTSAWVTLTVGAEREERYMTLISSEDKTVPVIVQTRAEISPNRAFDIITPIDLSLVFKGWGPFPAVRRVKNQTGEWDHAGPSRNPELSDGSTATESLTEYTAGHSFAYELTEFTNVLRRLVHGVRGEWTFTPDSHGTVIRWTYEFKPLVGRYFLVRRGLAPLWRRYMQVGVEAAALVAEEQAAHASASGSA